MIARWSLRSKLVGLLALVLLPVLGVVAWQSFLAENAAAFRRSAVLVTAADDVVARFATVVAGSHQLLSAMCANDVVQHGANPEAAPTDLNQCEAYLLRVVRPFPDEYSSAVVTDAQGVARCSSAPNAVGMNFTDREVFQTVKAKRQFTIGAHIPSRLSSHTVVPVALPILRDGGFAGMCAVGITLEALIGPAATPELPDNVGIAMVDRNGVAVGGNPAAMQGLPTTALLAALIGDQKEVSAFGRDGGYYRLFVKPIADSTFFAVAALPLPTGLTAFVESWGLFVLAVLAVGIALVVAWLGANHWCTRPLRYLQDFSEKVAQGEPIKLMVGKSWTAEFAGVGAGVEAMARAIASREAQLRAGLEQRDHMLREIHHRVKNNLQMISSLLNLQAGEIRSPRIRRFFSDAQNRVLTLSILHRHLYERSSWSLVDFQQFISDLVRQISTGRTPPGRPPPRYHIRAPIMAVGPDTAIPIGLIVTEAVSAVLAQDYTAVATPEIRIEATDKDGQVELVIEGNGATHDGQGFFDGHSGFGLTLVRGLAMQLGGEAQFRQREGGATRFLVVFPTPGRDEEENA